LTLAFARGTADPMAKRNTVFDHDWAARLSHQSANREWAPSREDTEGFFRAQTLGFRCAKEIAAEIREGWTERRVAKLMDTHLGDHGVRSFFHRSLCWVADRARFEGFEEARVLPEVASYRHFLPTKRAIRPHEVVILDTAPLVEGYPGDIGYTTSLGENAQLSRAKSFLGRLRRDIAAWFESPMTTRGIWERADEAMRKEGYDNRYTLYPFSVLGHRLRPIPLSKLPGLTYPLSIHALASLTSRRLFPDLLGPFHEGTKEGFWAIEPHLGGFGFGAKFEEILIAEPGRVRWLDETFAPG
jgi:peptidase M24-like protein